MLGGCSVTMGPWKPRGTKFSTLVKQTAGAGTLRYLCRRWENAGATRADGQWHAVLGPCSI